MLAAIPWPRRFSAYYDVFNLFYDVERVPSEDDQRVTAVGSPQRRCLTFLPEPSQQLLTLLRAANGFGEPDFATSRAKQARQSVDGRRLRPTSVGVECSLR